MARRRIRVEAYVMMMIGLVIFGGFIFGVLRLLALMDHV